LRRDYKQSLRDRSDLITDGVVAVELVLHQRKEHVRQLAIQQAALLKPTTH
jgi:hypothetical protein